MQYYDASDAHKALEEDGKMIANDSSSIGKIRVKLYAIEQIGLPQDNNFYIYLKHFIDSQVESYQA